MNKERKIVYTEPVDYFPKEIRDKYFNAGKAADKDTSAADNVDAESSDDTVCSEK